MARVLLVAYEGVQTLDVAGPAEVFANANRHLPRPRYAIEVLSTAGGDVSSTSGLPFRTRALTSVRPGPADTVLVAGGLAEAVQRAMADAALLAWLERASEKVQRIGSVCSGAFVLAEAGLLDGRRAATHWLGCDRLARLRPAIRVDPSAIFVRDGNVWTSAGVTTGIDMSLAMVEEDCGKGIADTVAARLVLYARRPGFQSQFSEVLVAQAGGDDQLGPAVAWARAHLSELDVPALARAAGLSIRTLHRRCLEQLDTTPAKLIARLRVEQARTLLSTTDRPAKVVAAQCGFGSDDRMRRAFARTLGVAPREYRLLFDGRTAPASATRADLSGRRGPLR